MTCFCLILFPRFFSISLDFPRFFHFLLRKPIDRSLAFRSSTCAIEFFLLFNYRILILACFLTPLLLMGGLYIKIFCLIKKHEVERSILSAVPSLDASHASPKTTPHVMVKQVDNKRTIPVKNCTNRNMNNNDHQCNWIRSVLKSPGGNGKNPVTSEVIFEVSNESNKNSNNESNKNSRNGRMSPCMSHVPSEPERVHRQEMDHLDVALASTPQESKPRHISVHISSASSASSANTHWKALSTTLIVLGTYLVCWMPAVCFLALTCIDGCPFPLGQMSSSSRLIIGFVCNSLVILKAIVDPFIYTFRMADVKVALKKFVGIDRRNRQKSARSLALSRSLTSRISN